MIKLKQTINILTFVNFSKVNLNILVRFELS
jgi:hypothetical protein